MDRRTFRDTHKLVARVLRERWGVRTLIVEGGSIHRCAATAPEGYAFIKLKNNYCKHSEVRGEVGHQILAPDALPSAA